jgi:hypothetical protein
MRAFLKQFLPCTDAVTSIYSAKPWLAESVYQTRPVSLAVTRKALFA